MEPFRVVLTDDHILVRQGLRKILEEMADLEVIGEAGNGLELLKLLETITPQMILLDISMPNLRGIEAIREIKTIHPQAKILILTMHNDIEYLYYAISAGANGYLLKEDADTELSAAIETIRRGRVYISPFFSGDLTDDWAQTYRRKSKLPYEPDNLTTREREVLKMVTEGKSNKDIADLLFISVRTVDRHRANLMDKLGLKKTADLVKYAIQKGYV